MPNIGQKYNFVRPGSMDKVVYTVANVSDTRVTIEWVRDETTPYGGRKGEAVTSTYPLEHFHKNFRLVVPKPQRNLPSWF